MPEHDHLYMFHPWAYIAELPVMSLLHARKSMMASTFLIKHLIWRRATLQKQAEDAPASSFSQVVIEVVYYKYRQSKAKQNEQRQDFQVIKSKDFKHVVTYITLLHRLVAGETCFLSSKLGQVGSGFEWLATVLGQEPAPKFYDGESVRANV